MVSILKLDSKQSSTIKNVLIVLMILAAVSAGSFGYGWIKGRNSCQTVDVLKAKKSLAASQNASGNTAKFNIEQQRKSVELKQEINEVQDACIKTDMAIDILPALNQ